MISGGPIRPASATAAPGAPQNRETNTTEKFTTLGPGRNCESAKASLNSSAVIQPFCSTIIRRAQGKAPPKPEIETMTNARKSSGSEGRLTGGAAAAEDSRQEGEKAPAPAARLCAAVAEGASAARGLGQMADQAPG